MVAAAVIGGAVVGGIATTVAGDKAAGATRDASNASVAEQRDALAQQERLSSPYRSFGEAAIPQLRALLGLPPAPSAPAPTGPPTLGSIPGYASGAGTSIGGQLIELPGGQMIRLPPDTSGGAMTNAPAAGAPTQPSTADALATLRATPGYQFTRDEGLKATANKASSMGLALSGNTLQELDRYSTGLADSTYQQAVGNLMNATSLGQAAAANQAANVGNAANSISSTLVNQGNNLANIDVNMGAGISRAVGGAMNDWASYQTLQDIYDFYEPPRKVLVKKEVRRG